MKPEILNDFHIPWYAWKHSPHWSVAMPGKQEWSCVLISMVISVRAAAPRLHQPRPGNGKPAPAQPNSASFPNYLVSTSKNGS